MMYAIPVLHITNDCSTNGDHSYLFGASYKLRLVSYGIKLVSYGLLTGELCPQNR